MAAFARSCGSPVCLGAFHDGPGQQDPRGCFARHNKNPLDVNSEIRDSSQQLLEDRFDPLGTGPLVRGTSTAKNLQKLRMIYGCLL
jgi:hypothetical protein